MHRMTGLDQFEGRWRLEREIDDRKGGLTGQLVGTAQFTPGEAGVLDYAEEGQLSYGNQPPMPAERRYIWKAGPDKRIDVFFEDGRPFHTIALDRLMPDDNHHCDPDFYHVSYDFTKWPEWRAIWRVVGPSKDYRMVSLYTRA